LRKDWISAEADKMPQVAHLFYLGDFLLEQLDLLPAI
jgi:hypothetical protein